MALVLGPAALLVQRCWRGLLGRRRVRRLILERLQASVVRPCAVCIQRVYRGLRGRRRAAQVRRLRDAAARIQGVVRGFLARRFTRRVRARIRRHHMAVRIQRLARGFLVRKIARRRREKRHRAMVVVPAAILLQAHIRGHLTRIRVRERRRQWFAALKIQSQFRCFLARRVTLARWREMRRQMEGRAAGRIQRAFRGRLGRRYALQLRLDLEGKRLAAARIVVRAMSRYLYGRKFRRLMDRWEVEESAKLLVDCSEEKRALEEDVEDIDTDMEQLRRCIRRYQARMEALKDFRQEAALRIPQVEAELDELGMEDIEAGWGDALEAEWESLTNRMALTAEELRQLKIQARNCEDDTMKLKLEREDYQMELELFRAREVAEYELLGRLEVARSERKAREERRKRVYRQQCRWKDASIRRKVVLRSLPYVAGLQAEVRGRRRAHDMGTLASERHWDRVDREAFLAQLMAQREGRRRARETFSAGFMNNEVRSTLDSVLASTLRVIKAATHPLRRPPDDLREDPRALCPTCGRVLCHCPGSQAYNAVRNPEADDD